MIQENNLKTKTMKKLIIILLALTLFSCDKEDEPCTCNVKVIIVDGVEGITGRYTITNVPSDCNGNVDWSTVRQDLPDNHWFDGVSGCN